MFLENIGGYFVRKGNKQQKNQRSVVFFFFNFTRHLLDIVVCDRVPITTESRMPVFLYDYCLHQTHLSWLDKMLFKGLLYRLSLFMNETLPQVEGRLFFVLFPDAPILIQCERCLFLLVCTQDPNVVITGNGRSKEGSGFFVRFNTLSDISNNWFFSCEVNERYWLLTCIVKLGCCQWTQV